ncbi:hypothetical protein TNCV_767461 [Trichonephila clavipes]|nr:hypothetical protein TNCV_767461 [Trichonephila clavipes]
MCDITRIEDVHWHATAQHYIVLYKNYFATISVNFCNVGRMKPAPLSLQMKTRRESLYLTQHQGRKQAKEPLSDDIVVHLCQVAILCRYSCSVAALVDIPGDNTTCLELIPQLEDDFRCPLKPSSFLRFRLSTSSLQTILNPKESSKPVLRNLFFIAADRSTFDNFTAAR